MRVTALPDSMMNNFRICSKFEKNSNISIATHSGSFHADEIVALSIFIDVHSDNTTFDIYRTRDKALINKCDFILDVGNMYDQIKMFDHHSKDFDVYYDTQIKYATAGLIWKHFGLDYIRNIDTTLNALQLKSVYSNMCEFIMTIDAVDNGQASMLGTTSETTLSQIISLYNPAEWNASTDAQNSQFINALHFCMEFLALKVKDEIYNVKCSDKVYEALTNSTTECLYLDEAMPWKHVILANWETTKHFKLCIYPTSNSNAYTIITFPKDPADIYSMRCPAPKSIRGIDKKDIENITGISGIIFCHVNGFMASTNSKHSAKQLAEWWIDNGE